MARVPDVLNNMPAFDMSITDHGKTRSISFVGSTGLLVQRRLEGDCKKWRTVFPIRADQLDLVTEWIRVAQHINPAVKWRLTHLTGQPV